MLRQILSITGKPGLFKIVANGNRMLVVEDLATGKRFPASARDKVVSLGDISMYTDADDKPLGEILDLVYTRNEGKKIDIKGLADRGGLREEFEAVLPDFDRDRVYDSDIRKLFTWYNILVDAGFSKFAEEKKTPEAEDSAE